MLNAWVYALAVEGWVDMTVVVDDHQMSHVECGDESEGKASTGWECLFLPTPHLCTFESDVVSEIFFRGFSSSPCVHSHLNRGG